MAGAPGPPPPPGIYGDFLAIDPGMDAVQPGELGLILVDQVEAALAHIASKVQTPT